MAQKSKDGRENDDTPEGKEFATLQGLYVVGECAHQLGKSENYTCVTLDCIAHIIHALHFSDKE